MPKKLLMTGGGIQIFFILFHAAFWMMFRWPQSLQTLDPLQQAVMQTFNVQTIWVMAFFAYVSIVHWQDLLSTRLGNGVALTIALFYMIRAVNQLIFFEFDVVSLILTLVCLGIGVLYLVPLKILRQRPAES